jgi:ElaB/YqjD/DUF883 family membrane-anchored ribosome-binding protein
MQTMVKPTDSTPAATDHANDHRAEAKSRFSKALDEAKAGVAELKAEAMEKSGSYKDRAGEKGEQLKGDAAAYGEQAKAKAYELANDTKSKTSEGMVALSKLITDNVATVDEKLGVKYGDYARSAAGSLEKNAASLDEKSLEQLGDDAREYVRKSPGTAIAIAAGAGFLLARLFRRR